jgi:cysteine-rich repeat protein
MAVFTKFMNRIGGTPLKIQNAATSASRSSSGVLCLFVSLGLYLTWAAPVQSAILVSIDLDPDTAGIQTQREVASGGSLVANIVVQTDAGGLSSYAISAQFDSVEVDLSGVPAATEFLPTGFDANLTSTGVESETEDNGTGTGQVLTFEAVAYASGPVSSTFIAGEINFTVTSPDDSAVLDVDSGFFNLAIDGAFDNAGQPATLSFAGAFVDPQICGDSFIQGNEQCDDGNVNDLDGCSQLCRNENQYYFYGTAQGGTVTFVVDGFAVNLATSPGQTASAVANAIATAINADPNLSILDATAIAVGNLVVVGGSIDSVTLGDAGLVAAVPLSPMVIPFLALGLLGSALFVFYRGAPARHPRIEDH